MREYTREEYGAKLEALTDEQLYEECVHNIWLSAFANNNPRSAFHWQADACYGETSRRHKDDIYERAYNVVRKQASVSR